MFFKRIPLAYDLLLLFSTSEACLALTPLGLKMFNVRRNTSGLDLDRARALDFIFWKPETTSGRIGLGPRPYPALIRIPKRKDPLQSLKMDRAHFFAGRIGLGLLHMLVGSGSAFLRCGSGSGFLRCGSGSGFLRCGSGFRAQNLSNCGLFRAYTNKFIVSFQNLRIVTYIYWQLDILLLPFYPKIHKSAEIMKFQKI